MSRSMTSVPDIKLIRTDTFNHIYLKQIFKNYIQGGFVCDGASYVVTHGLK